MQEEEIEQDIRIAVFHYHTFEDEPKERLTPGSSSRSPLFLLIAELGKKRVIYSLLVGNEDRMGRSQKD